MSNAEGAARLLEAATELGIARGVGALTLQGVASAGGVSKALVLYHFGGKRTLLETLVRQLASARTAALQRAASAQDPMSAWRDLARDQRARGEHALLASLLQEEDLRHLAAALATSQEAAATALAAAVLAALGLRPRVSAALLGRMLLHHLDGLALGASRETSTLDAELDAMALALLALGD